jgi:transcriptional regulator with XRE-family HTH domain
MSAQRFTVVSNPAQRRGKLAAEQPGEMVFTDQFSYVQAMQGEVRTSHRKFNKLAEAGDMSGSTVANMAKGKTRLPRFSTMFGLANALGLEVTFRPRKR